MTAIKKRLLNLAIGELAATLVFIYVYSLTNLGRASQVTFFYLVFILLQGSIYWFYRYRLITIKKEPSFKVVRFLRFLKNFNILILAFAVILVPFLKNSILDLIIAIGLLVFGIVEYINYYWYRLSYGKSGFNIKILRETGLKQSSINKLIYFND